MTHIPQVLGIFTDIYGKDAVMDMPKALLISLVGFVTVIVILAIIALFVKLITFVFGAFNKKTADAPASATATPAPVQAPAVRDPELINVDEKTAAVVMAIVSHESGIPLNRLEFKSIKLMEDKK